MIEKFKGFSTSPRRRIASIAMKALWPIEFREGAQGNLEAFNKVLAEGHGAIGLVPHFSKGDFLTILVALARNSKEFRKRPILIPIAAHQRPAYLDWICNFGNVNLTTVITDDTKQKEAQLKAAKEPIPWSQLSEHKALSQYWSKATDTLQKGGIVILAPQGGRRDCLNPFPGDPVTMLEKLLTRKKVAIPALFTIGLEVSGASDYSELKGLNLRDKYIATLGQTVRREGISGNLDTWGYQEMLQLAPPTYRP